MYCSDQRRTGREQNRKFEDFILIQFAHQFNGTANNSAQTFRFQKSLATTLRLINELFFQIHSVYFISYEKDF